MKRTLIYTVISGITVIGSTSGAMAQSHERVYLDETMHVVSNPQNASYYQTAVRDGNKYIARVYYANGQIKMEGSFEDAALTKRDGLFFYYFENGNLESKGYYCDHQKCGVWNRWNFDGSTRADRIYPDPEAIYRNGPVETPATFPGGYGALMDFIQDETIYPPEALKKEIEGTVKISFRIDEGGLVRDVEVAKESQYFLDRAALECVWKMPLWTPAKREGSTKPSNFIIPIRFSIKDGEGKVGIGH